MPTILKNKNKLGVVVYYVIDLKITKCMTLTVAVCASCYLPQHQPKGPDVHSLIGIKAICLNGLVQHFRCHVALGTDFWVVAHIQQVVCLGVSHSEPCKHTVTHSVIGGLTIGFWHMLHMNTQQVKKIIK